MTNKDREKQIENFLNKWDDMLQAANEISDFKWKFNVSISSNDSIMIDRVKTINGINLSFAKNGYNVG